MFGVNLSNKCLKPGSELALLMLRKKVLDICRKMLCFCGNVNSTKESKAAKRAQLERERIAASKNPSSWTVKKKTNQTESNYIYIYYISIYIYIYCVFIFIKSMLEKPREQCLEWSHWSVPHAAPGLRACSPALAGSIQITKIHEKQRQFQPIAGSMALPTLVSMWTCGDALMWYDVIHKRAPTGMRGRTTKTYNVYEHQSFAIRHWHPVPFVCTCNAIPSNTSKTVQTYTKTQNNPVNTTLVSSHLIRLEKCTAFMASSRSTGFWASRASIFA